LILGGGWQSVATLLLAAACYLPHLPKHPLWPFFMEWGNAVMTAACFLAPFWTDWWLRWLAYGGLVLFLIQWAPQAARNYRNKRAWRAQLKVALHMSSAAVAAARAQQAH
jgi:hypothetical protein